MGRDTLLVVPTCRPQSLTGFFRAWNGKGGWDRTLVVEDSPHVSSYMKVIEDQFRSMNITSVTHGHVDAVLGDTSWIISRQDSAVRCFGFLAAWEQGVDVLTLDDDCHPQHDADDFVALHRRALKHPVWIESVPGVRTRGLPYRDRGEVEAKVNVGLWTGAPDFDGPQSLVSNPTDFAPSKGNRIVPQGQFTQVCGMNLFIKHEALPLFFFPMMGKKPDGSSWPFQRFDDIWAGVIAKHCMDHLGWVMSVGEPWVHHKKASDPFVNLVKEAPGIGHNERFWRTIKAVKLTASTATGCVHEVGQALVNDEHEYHRDLGKALQVWAKLFEKRVA